MTPKLEPVTVNRKHGRYFYTFASFIAISSLTNGSVVAEVTQFQPKSIPLTTSAIIMM